MSSKATGRTSQKRTAKARAGSAQRASAPATRRSSTATRKRASAAKRPVFPSVEWFEQLATITMKDEGYRKFGRLNAVVAFVIGEKHIEATFDILDIHSVREVSENDLRGADFVIELEPEHWKAMLGDIKKNGHATDEWTLNTLDLRFDEPIHRNLLDDGFKADMFFRYNPSLQRFFDNASQLTYRFDRSLG